MIQIIDFYKFKSYIILCYLNFINKLCFFNFYKKKIIILNQLSFLNTFFKSTILDNKNRKK